MAYIEPQYDNKGNITHYRLFASNGYNYQGKQIRKTTMWWPPEKNMPKRKMKQQAMMAAYEFEKKLEQGYQVDDNQTFADYAQYVMELKQRSGLAATTLERYQGLLRRINPAIGHMKLRDIRPQHLNELYKELAEHGIREDTHRAVPRKVLAKKIKALGIPKYQIAEKCGVSQTTLNAAIRGDSIRTENAEGIANALGYDFSELFTEKFNTTPLSDKTILEHHRLISTIFSQADKELLIPYNPAAKATPPKVKKHKVESFQPEDMEDIITTLQNAPIKWKTMTYILIDTGCRRGELMGLQWKHIDFDKGTMMIEQALLYTKDKGVYVGPPKNGQPRAMCLAPESLDMLKQWKKEQLRIRMKNGLIWQDTGFIFTKDDGTVMHPDSITDWLGKFSKEEDLPHIHPHLFRHTAASTLIANGIDLVTTAAEMGHTDATTTAKIYAHQIAKARAAAAGVRAGVFATLRKAE